MKKLLKLCSRSYKICLKINKNKAFINFLYVKDIMKAMNIPNISGKFFFVETSKKISINDLITIFNKKYSKSVKVNYLLPRSRDIKESICDNKKINQFLGLEVFIEFEEGILNL